MNSETSQILAQETLLANQVAQKASLYAKSQIRQSSIKLRGIGSPYKRGGKSEAAKNERLPVVDATYIRPDMGTYRLLGFTFISNRVGFVHHFGVTAANSAHLRTSKNGKTFKYKTSGLDSQSFFDEIYQKSGAFNMLEQGLAITRTQAISVALQNLVLKIND